MDKIANQLRHDADKIDVKVSDELDHRIAASLRNVTLQNEAPAAPLSRRPALFWWASSLTGIAAAAAVILVVNTQQRAEPAAATPANIVAAVPMIDWQTETAAVTVPLQQELDNLRSDFRKAEKKVKADIGL